MYKISPSLLDAFINARVGKYRSTYNDFIKYLKGEFIQTEVQIKGLRFEELVYSNLADANSCRMYFEEFTEQENNVALSIAENIGIVEKQVFLQKTISIDGDDILLKGYADAISEYSVHDIKYSNAKSVPKYNDSMQWRFYLYMSGKKKFIYELCHKGEYTRHVFKNNSGVEFEIQYYCRMMINWLKDNELINFITIK